MFVMKNPINPWTKIDKHNDPYSAYDQPQGCHQYKPFSTSSNTISIYRALTMAHTGQDDWPASDQDERRAGWCGELLLLLLLLLLLPLLLPQSYTDGPIWQWWC